MIIDLDPQQSAARWARLRQREEPVILPGHGPNLPDLVKRAKDNGADLLIIDTAPKSENASLMAARLSDLILIPCQPSNLDLDAVADSVNIASLAKVKAAFVLNNCRSSSGLADDAADALSAYGLPLAPVRIGSRVAFVKSLTEGKGVLEYEPKGLLPRKSRTLPSLHVSKEACEHVDMRTRLQSCPAHSRACWQARLRICARRHTQPCPHCRMKTFAPHRVRSCSQVRLLPRAGTCGQSRTSAHCQRLLRRHASMSACAPCALSKLSHNPTSQQESMRT